MSTYPERLLTADETLLVELRPHWRVLIPTFMWFVLGIGAVAAAYLAYTDGPEWLPPVVALLSLLFVLGLGLPPLLRWWFTNYVLTTERIVVRTGMIARSGTEIPLESISNVAFKQSVLERMLGYGDVLLESAGESGQSRLRDVPKPEDFQSKVYEAREKRAMYFSGGGQPAPRDAIAQLEALAGLHERGKITDDEYATQKASLLGPSTPSGDIADTRPLGPPTS
jgi:membrane protein YdbS with pleckstrin-like domain